MASFERRRKALRKERYKLLKKAFKARDLASPYVSKKVKVKDVYNWYDVYHLSVKSIANMIIGRNGDFERPTPPPRRNPPTQPISEIESVVQQLKGEGWAGIDIRRAFKNLEEETRNQPIIQGENALDEYLDQLEEENEVKRLAKGEVYIRRDELLDVFGLPLDVEITNLRLEDGKVVIELMSHKPVMVEGKEVTHEIDDEMHLYRKLFLRNRHKPVSYFEDGRIVLKDSKTGLQQMYKPLGYIGEFQGTPIVESEELKE